jgi:hypothetical protein
MRLRCSGSTIAESALRPGDKVTMAGVPNEDMPPEFWKKVCCVGLTVCYSSVFNEFFVLRDSSLGARTKWEHTDACPLQSEGEDF